MNTEITSWLVSVYDFYSRVVENHKAGQFFRQSTADYVSDEEDGVGVNNGQWMVMCPVWRSKRAKTLMDRHKTLQDSSNEARQRPRGKKQSRSHQEDQPDLSRRPWKSDKEKRPARNRHHILYIISFQRDVPYFERSCPLLKLVSYAKLSRKHFPICCFSAL